MQKSAGTLLGSQWAPARGLGEGWRLADAIVGHRSYTESRWAEVPEHARVSILSHREHRIARYHIADIIIVDTGGAVDSAELAEADHRSIHARDEGDRAALRSGPGARSDRATTSSSLDDNPRLLEEAARRAAAAASELTSRTLLTTS